MRLLYWKTWRVRFLTQEKPVIIENFNGVISLVTKEEGETFVTEDLSEAKRIAGECQQGIVVPLKPFEE